MGYQNAEESPLSGSLASDISQGGVRIRVQQFIPLRTIVNLKIHLNNPSRSVPVKGQVVWVREVPDAEEVFDVGIQFLEIDSTDSALQSYIRFQEMKQDNNGEEGLKGV